MVRYKSLSLLFGGNLANKQLLLAASACMHSKLANQWVSLLQPICISKLANQFLLQPISISSSAKQWVFLLLLQPMCISIQQSNMFFCFKNHTVVLLWPQSTIPETFHMGICPKGVQAAKRICPSFKMYLSNLKIYFSSFDEKRYTSAIVDPPVPKLYFAQMDALNDCLVIENLANVSG